MTDLALNHTTGKIPVWQQQEVKNGAKEEEPGVYGAHL